MLLPLGLLAALSWLPPGPDAPGLDAARKLLDERRYAEALKAFKSAHAVSQGRCAPCLLGMAEAQLALGKLDDVIESASEAVRRGLEPGALASRAYSVTGIALLKRGRPTDVARAEAAFRDALSSDATNVRAHFNLGYVLLLQARDEEGSTQLREYLAGEPQGGPSDQARWLLENPRRARERFAPALETKTLSGERLSLEAYKGKVVLLDFWATWCGPCRAAVPELKDLLRKYPKERFAIVSISVDDELDRVEKFVAKNGITWAQCHDAEGVLMKRFGVEVLPSYLLVDGEGVIRKELTGTDDQRSLGSRLKEMLASLPELTTP